MWAGNGQAGQAQNGGREVDEADECGRSVWPGLAPRRRGGGTFRESDEQGHLEPAIVQHALAARQAAAVVAVEEDDGVVGQAVGFELVEDLADFGVHDA